MEYHKVKNMIYQAARRARRVEFDDAVGAGNEIYALCLKKFDKKYGCKFSTFLYANLRALENYRDDVKSVLDVSQLAEPDLLAARRQTEILVAEYATEDVRSLMAALLSGRVKRPTVSRVETFARFILGWTDDRISAAMDGLRELYLEVSFS